MKTCAAFLVFLFLAAGMLPAQATGPEAEDIARVLVRAQLPAQVFDDLYGAVSAGMVAQLGAAFEPRLGRPLSDEEAAVMRQFWAAKLAELLPYGSFLDGAAELVRERLSVEEMGAIVDFYRNSAFSKLVRSAGSAAGGLIPEVMQEAGRPEGLGEEAKDRLMMEAGTAAQQRAVQSLTNEELGAIARFEASPLGAKHAELMKAVLAHWQELAAGLPSRLEDPAWLERTVTELLLRMPSLMGPE